MMQVSNLDDASDAAIRRKRSALSAGPVVGVTTYAVLADWMGWPMQSALTPVSYVDRLVRAGATTVLLPVTANRPEAPRDSLTRLDGLVLVGGEDVCGRFYGRSETDEEHDTHSHHPDRDLFEISMAKTAWELGLPILAICRGVQVLNVALGGTLIPDLPSAGASQEHLLTWGDFNHHSVSFTPDSALHRLYGAKADVPSHHHQAIDTLADDLVVTGRTSDGIIEAVEAHHGRSVLGVQWHPEEGTETVLFDAFVKACGAAT